MDPASLLSTFQLTLSSNPAELEHAQKLLLTVGGAVLPGPPAPRSRQPFPPSPAGQWSVEPGFTPSVMELVMRPDLPEDLRKSGARAWPGAGVPS